MLGNYRDRLRNGRIPSGMINEIYDTAMASRMSRPSGFLQGMRGGTINSDYMPPPWRQYLVEIIGDESIPSSALSEHSSTSPQAGFYLCCIKYYDHGKKVWAIDPAVYYLDTSGMAGKPHFYNDRQFSDNYDAFGEAIGVPPALNEGDVLTAWWDERRGRFIPAQMPALIAFELKDNLYANGTADAYVLQTLSESVYQIGAEYGDLANYWQLPLRKAKGSKGSVVIGGGEFRKTVLQGYEPDESKLVTVQNALHPRFVGYGRAWWDDREANEDSASVNSNIRGISASATQESTWAFYAGRGARGWAQAIPYAKGVVYEVVQLEPLVEAYIGRVKKDVTASDYEFAVYGLRPLTPGRTTPTWGKEHTGVNGDALHIEGHIRVRNTMRMAYKKNNQVLVFNANRPANLDYRDRSGYALADAVPLQHPSRFLYCLSKQDSKKDGENYQQFEATVIGPIDGGYWNDGGQTEKITVQNKVGDEAPAETGCIVCHGNYENEWWLVRFFDNGWKCDQCNPSKKAQGELSSGIGPGMGALDTVDLGNAASIDGGILGDEYATVAGARDGLRTGTTYTIKARNPLKLTAAAGTVAIVDGHASDPNSWVITAVTPSTQKVLTNITFDGVEKAVMGTFQAIAAPASGSPSQERLADLGDCG